MTKEEFKIQEENYNKQITDLNKQIREIDIIRNRVREAYIEEHREFQNGDLVEVTTQYNPIPKRAFVNSASESEGEIYYRLIKIKKDGKPSRRRLWIGYYDKPSFKLISTEYRNKNFDGTPIEE